MSTSDLVALNNMTDFQSEILLEKNFNGRQPDFNDFDAVLNCVSRMDSVKKLQYQDYNYMINTNEPIEVARDIYFELQPRPAEDVKTGVTSKIIYRLYSDALGIKDLKEYITNCRQEYEAQRNNKLGNDIFFFDQVTSNDTKFCSALAFDKKNFTTFRTFDNVFFEEREEVEGRVKHFLENKSWYMKRGIPYTLGFMFHGAPGTGKSLLCGTRVLLYDGSIKAVEQLVVGDLLMGDDAIPRRVGNVHHGRDIMYQIKQDNGDNFITNSVHILSLKLGVPFSTTWHAKHQYFRLNWFENFEPRHAVFAVHDPNSRATAVKYDTRKLAWTALDALKQELINNPQINKKNDIIDIELPDYLKKSSAWRYAFKGFKRDCVDWWPATTQPQDPYMVGLEAGKSVHPVVISTEYMRCSVAQRLALLAGFLDAASHVSKDNNFEFCHQLRAVFDDICFVARSLGYMVTEAVPKEYQNILYYRASIHIHNTDDLPVKNHRKCPKRHDPYLLYNIEVERLSEDEYVGITVDGNGRFCLKDFTVTHNTSTIKSIANVTRRHIINVRLSEIKTNTQLKNLFFNPVLQVVNPETLNVEKFVVPIHQRLYVIEDIDCMTDLVKRRDFQTVESEDDEDEKRVKVAPKKKVVAPDFLDGDEELQSYYDDALGGEKTDMVREGKAEEARDKITFDSLLNIFDGTYEIPNRMFCITTNHLEVIDPALIRPGRVDMIIEFKNCTKAIIKQMFDSFYEQTFDGSKFTKIKDYKISPASVNQVLFKHFTRPEAAIEELIMVGNKRRVYKKRDPLTTQDE